MTVECLRRQVSKAEHHEITSQIISFYLLLVYYNPGEGTEDMMLALILQTSIWRLGAAMEIGRSSWSNVCNSREGCDER